MRLAWVRLVIITLSKVIGKPQIEPFETNKQALRSPQNSGLMSFWGVNEGPLNVLKSLKEP